MKQSLLVFLDHHDLYAMKYVTLLLRDVKEKVRTGKFFCHQKILHLKTALETGSMDQPVQRHNFPAFLPRLIYSLYS